MAQTAKFGFIIEAKFKVNLRGQWGVFEANSMVELDSVYQKPKNINQNKIENT